MSFQAIVQDVASVANVLSVIVVGVGYYFMIKLYREWVRLREETRAAGGRPQVVVAADYGHIPRVDIVVKNFTKAPAREVKFQFSAPVEDPEGNVLSDLPYFREGLPFLEPEGEIGRFWGHLPELATMLRQRGLQEGIRVMTNYRDLAGESYETEWTLNPLLFEGSGINDSRGMNALVHAVERIPRGAAGRDGQRGRSGSGW